MDMSISRAALILYSPATTGRERCALFGKGRSGITTLGGRIAPGETWLDCLVRELIEETRGILNYSLYKDIFITAPHKCYDQCVYVFYETTYERLVAIAQEFPLTTSTRDVCNEMCSLEVCPIDDLLRDMIVYKKQRYNEVFHSMFLTVGYDTLKGNTCNHITAKIDLEGELHVPISRLPRVVCLTPIRRDVPIVYGTILSKGLIITDQYYMDEDDRRLFRSGYVLKNSA